MAEAGPLFHLADGVLLGLDSRRSVLVDLVRGVEVPVDFGALDAVEQLSLGAPLAGHAALVEKLAEQQLVAPGPARVDPVLAARLARLDELFLAAYRGALDERSLRAYELTLQAHARRKRFFGQVGQCPTLPETSLRRALSVGDAALVGSQRIICVGDDDLVSVPLAALGHRVTVYDVDPFLLSFLRATCLELGLAVEVLDRDLRDPLAAEELAAFDVFLTDPMPNPECFELFLSRGVALVRPGGRGLVAVYGRTGRLFEQVAASMRLPIVAWRARHNRYYTRRMLLHPYESDWVELSRTAQSVPKCPPDELCVSLELYRDRFFHRPPTLVGFFDEIENVAHAMPTHLDLLLDAVAARTGLALYDRRTHAAEDWCLLAAVTEKGHLSLHVDRRRRQLALELFPYDPEVEDVLRRALIGVYKEHAREARTVVSRDTCDVRIR